MSYEESSIELGEDDTDEEDIYALDKQEDETGCNLMQQQTQTCSPAASRPKKTARKCRHCQVPMRGHVCPFRKRKDDVKASASLGLPKRQLSEDDDNSSSTELHNRLPQQRHGDYNEQRQQLERQPRILKGPLLAPTRPAIILGKSSPERHRKERYRSRNEGKLDRQGDSVPKESTSLMRIPLAQRRKVHMCKHCQVPIKGHVCPHRKGTTASTLPHRSSSHDDESNQDVSSIQVNDLVFVPQDGDHPEKKRPRILKKVYQQQQHVHHLGPETSVPRRSDSDSDFEEPDNNKNKGWTKAWHKQEQHDEKKQPRMLKNVFQQQQHRLGPETPGPKKSDSDSDFEEPNNKNARSTKARPEQFSRKAEKEPSKILRTNLCRHCGVPRKGHECPYHQPVFSPPLEEEPANYYDESSSSSDRALQPKRKRGRPRNTLLSAAANGKSDSEPLATAEWTQVMAPLHIFQDEVHAYRRANRLTNGEEQFFDMWSRLVEKELLQQNELVTEHLKVETQHQRVATRVQEERDALVRLRSQIRRNLVQEQDAQRTLATSRQTQATRRAASRFLDVADRLKK